ncbi:phage tail protein, partial [Enterobacter asburiae]
DTTTNATTTAWATARGGGLRGYIDPSNPRHKTLSNIVENRFSAESSSFSWDLQKHQKHTV